MEEDLNEVAVEVIVNEREGTAYASSEKYEVVAGGISYLRSFPNDIIEDIENIRRKNYFRME